MCFESHVSSAEGLQMCAPSCREPRLPHGPWLEALTSPFHANIDKCNVPVGVGSHLKPTAAFGICLSRELPFLRPNATWSAIDSGGHHGSLSVGDPTSSLR